MEISLSCVFTSNIVVNDSNIFSGSSMVGAGLAGAGVGGLAGAGAGGLASSFGSR